MSTRGRRPTSRAVRALGAAWSSLLIVGCVAPSAPRYPGFNPFSGPVPAPPPVVGGVGVSEADHRALVELGARSFRDETFGGERMVTDVVGMLNAPIEVPCGAGGCTKVVSSLPYFVQALDELDGERGNLYTGNGGPQGTGTTHDLTLRFPPGSRLHGLPLPAEVHTGLDVEAGAAWPIGIVPVEAEASDASLPYVWDLAALGAGPTPAERHVRIGISCALCHYSLDVDWDGKLDLKSARLGHPTAGSRYRPEHSWAVGNQDLQVGWLFAISQNPLVGFGIFSGPIADHAPRANLAWADWVRDNYRVAPLAVTREVVRGMLLQPRGYADVTSNARYNASQFPPLLTQHNWPSNSDGAVLNGTDRNSVVWTSTLDFSGVIGLARDRGGSDSAGLYWEEPGIYSRFTAEQLADVFVHLSPAALHDPARGDALKQDILGNSDGVPGLLDPSSMFVMRGPGNVIPEALLHHPENERAGRIATTAQFGGDAAARGPMMALLGIRARTRPRVLEELRKSGFLARNPKLNADDIQGEAVNAALDWQPSPPNETARLARARGLVEQGYRVFQEAGCASCHRGPFFTDNVLHRISARRGEEVGVAAPSTAGFRSLGRGKGPAIGTQPERAVDSRILYSFVAPTYDPSTGLAVAPGGPLNGLLGSQTVGYKTTQLRYVWGSAPYLHDGSIGVAIRPQSAVERDDLRAVLRLGASDKIYGMGAILAHEAVSPLRADAALSLQALVLEAERSPLLARRRDAVIPVPGIGASENVRGAPSHVSALDLGIDGAGHEFYIDDAPGGERVSALVAFLLAIDDDVRDLPAEAGARP